MKKAIFATLLIISITGYAQAQLRKCTGPDGRVTYSDVLCSTNSSSGSIKSPDGNSLDHSGFREQSQKSQTARDAMDSGDRMSVARQSTPQECKFSYFSVGDEKGKTLATNAKDECLRNIEAKRAGRAVSLEDYNFWKDHYSQKSANRQAATSRANSDANARETQQAIGRIEDGNRKFTCKPNLLGSAFDCN